MALFTTITGAEFYESLIEDSAEGFTDWSISKSASCGDRVLFYICRPFSAIIAVAQLADDPRLESDLNDTWYGKYFVRMENLKILKQPVQRHRLLQEFSDWKYWKQPRNSIKVPADYETQILDLINQSV